MAWETYLLEIPIYRCSRDQFDQRYDADLEAYIANLWPNAGDWVPDRDELIHIKQRYWEQYGAPWRYNQTVGWIRLYTLGSQLRGELWFVNAKKLVRRPAHRQIALRGKAFELTVYPEDTSATITTRIRKDMLECVKEYRRVRLHLDLECFDNLAAHIDWHKYTRGASPDA